MRFLANPPGAVTATLIDLGAKAGIAIHKKKRPDVPLEDFHDLDGNGFGPLRCKSLLEASSLAPLHAVAGWSWWMFSKGTRNV